MNKIVLTAAIAAILSSTSVFADTATATSGFGPATATTLDTTTVTVDIPVTDSFNQANDNIAVDVSNSLNGSFNEDDHSLDIDDVAVASGNGAALVDSDDATIATSTGNAIADNDGSAIVGGNGNAFDGTDNSAVVGGNGDALNDSVIQSSGTYGINLNGGYEGQREGGFGIVQGGHSNTIIEGDVTAATSVAGASNSQTQSATGTQSQAAGVEQSSVVVSGSGEYEYAPVLGAPGAITVGGENNSVDDSVANTGSNAVVANDDGSVTQDSNNTPVNVTFDDLNAAIANDNSSAAVSSAAAASSSNADDITTTSIPVTVTVDDVIVGDENAVNGSSIADDTNSNNDTVTESGPGNASN